MPADPDALEAIGRSPSSDEFINSTALANPKLAFLGDIIPTPASLARVATSTASATC